MRLNRYVIKVDYDEDNLILYNTINRSVILLNKKEFSQPNENVIKTLANYEFLSTIR